MPAAWGRPTGLAAAARAARAAYGGERRRQPRRRPGTAARTPSGPARPGRRRYLGQLALAILAIMAALLLVDSVAEAILAAGSGSSVVIVFMHPTSRSASLRHLVGGHFLGLVVGVTGSLLLLAIAKTLTRRQFKT